MPVITFLVSPLVGGTYCIFNRLECLFRLKAGMPLIEDRVGHLLEVITKEVKRLWERSHQSYQQ